MGPGGARGLRCERRQEISVEYVGVYSLTLKGSLRAASHCIAAHCITLPCKHRHGHGHGHGLGRMVLLEKRDGEGLLTYCSIPHTPYRKADQRLSACGGGPRMALAMNVIGEGPEKVVDREKSFASSSGLTGVAGGAVWWLP